MVLPPAGIARVDHKIPYNRSTLIGLEIKKGLHKLNISKETQKIRKLDQYFQCAKK